MDRARHIHVPLAPTPAGTAHGAWVFRSSFGGAPGEGEEKSKSGVPTGAAIRKVIASLAIAGMPSGSVKDGTN